MQGNYDTLMRSTKSVEALTNAGVDVACIGGEQICEWSRATAQEKVAALLANYSDNIDAVISCNDDMAWAPTHFMWTAQTLGSIKAGFVWIQLRICAVVLMMVPFCRLDKEMPAVRAALAHERKETAR